MALFATPLRSRKRRITIRDAQIAVAGLAAAFTLILRGPFPLAIVGLLTLYTAPFFGAALYLTKGWDVVAALSWSIGALWIMALIVTGS
jgi:hypothetical protein